MKCIQDSGRFMCIKWVGINFGDLEYVASGRGVSGRSACKSYTIVTLFYTDNYESRYIINYKIKYIINY